MPGPPPDTPAAVAPSAWSIRSQSGWQIELFFKELKSTLGFDQYRFRDFNKVEAWVELVAVTFLYLEWHRVRQLN